VDFSNGYVTVDNKSFIKADLNNKGTTYTSQTNFDKAASGFNFGPSNQALNQMPSTAKREPVLPDVVMKAMEHQRN
jgi:hypothetical protein